MNIELSDVVNVLENKQFENKKQLTAYLNERLQLTYTYDQWKGHWRRNKEFNDLIFTYIKSSIPNIDGFFAEDETVIFEHAYNTALSAYNSHILTLQKKINSTITFDVNQPICIVNIADVHFGHYSVNPEQVFNDLDIIEQIPNCYVNLVGDLTDNFIGSWTAPINYNNTISIKTQYALRNAYLRRLIENNKLLAAVSGNHDNWSTSAIGNDLLAETISHIQKKILYDAEQIDYTLNVYNRSYKVRLRHMWKGRSDHNPTYGIEKMAMAEKSFDIGIGGHWHIGGFYREFSNAGNLGVAILCGSYKTHDDYARKLGLYKVNDKTAICFIVHPDYGVFGMNNLYAAADYMTAIM